jgi:small-conductance mechanosensitive channel
MGRVAHNAVRLAGWAIGLFLVYVWLTFALRRFPYTRPWAEALFEFFLNVVGTIGNAAAQAIPGLVFVVVIVVITRAAVHWLKIFLLRVESGRVQIGWLDADTAAPTRRILTTVLWLFALAMAYPYLPGSGSEAFKGLSVLVGVMISIGASGIVGQAAGGLMITYTHTLRLGEFVRIGDTEGTVTDLGIFATRIRTGLGEEVTLPNAYVVANTIKNYSRMLSSATGFALSAHVTIGYSTPWRQVHAMLIQAAQRTAGVLAEPKPFVVQTALSDFYVEYRVVCCAGPEGPKQRALAMDALHANIQDVFNENEVQIMSPHYMMDPAHPQIVPKDKWYAPPAQAPDR